MIYRFIGNLFVGTCTWCLLMVMSVGAVITVVVSIHLFWVCDVNK